MKTNKILLGSTVILLVTVAYLVGKTQQTPKSEPIATTLPSLSPSPLPSSNPAPTQKTVNVVQQTPIPKYDPVVIGKAIKAKYPVYNDIPDEVLGNSYIKTYITFERKPTTYFSPSFSLHCTTNTVGDYTYTNCN